MSYTYYKQIGKHVHTYGRLTFGSTSVMGSNAYFTMPVNEASTVADYQVFGTAQSSHSTTFFGWSIIKLPVATAAHCFQPVYYSPSGGALTVVGSAINQPQGVNWTTGDILWWNAVYEAA